MCNGAARTVWSERLTADGADHTRGDAGRLREPGRGRTRRVQLTKNVECNRRGVLIAAPVFWLFTKLLAIQLPGLTASGWL